MNISQQDLTRGKLRCCCCSRAHKQCEVAVNFHNRDTRQLEQMEVQLTVRLLCCSPQTDRSVHTGTVTPHLFIQVNCAHLNTAQTGLRPGWCTVQCVWQNHGIHIGFSIFKWQCITNVVKVCNIVFERVAHSCNMFLNVRVESQVTPRYLISAKFFYQLTIYKDIWTFTGVSFVREVQGYCLFWVQREAWVTEQVFPLSAYIQGLKFSAMVPDFQRCAVSARALL